MCGRRSFFPPFQYCGRNVLIALFALVEGSHQLVRLSSPPVNYQHSSVSFNRTHVAGTACGAVFGVSANCRLCAVKVLGNAGSGSIAGVIAGVNHVVSKCSSSRCVANMSLGGDYSATLNQAVADAVNAGVVVVVAAGNDNVDACGASPASEQSVITVGSTDNTDHKSSFSNWGSCVDVHAPGSLIPSAWNNTSTGYVYKSGTSMASPRECLHHYTCLICPRPSFIVLLSF